MFHKWINFNFKLMRFVADYAVIHISFYLGFKIYFLDQLEYAMHCCPELRPELYFKPISENYYLTISFGVWIFTAIVYSFLKLYKDDTSILHVREYRFAISGYIIACFLFLSVYYLWFAYLGQQISVREKLFSRRIFGYSSMLSILGIISLRALINKIKYIFHRKGKGGRRVLIYGAGETGKLIARRLTEFPAFGMITIGFIDDDASLTNTKVTYDPARNLKLPVLGTGEQLKHCVTQSKVDDVLVAVPSGTTKEVLNIVNYCNNNNISFKFVPNVYEIAIQRTTTSNVAGIPMISVKKASRRYIFLFAKRIFDICASIIGIVLLSPLTLFICILVKTGSKGSAVFSQTRIGLNGKPFKMFKFRTMYSDAKKYEITPLNSSDKRITKFGKFLRKTSFDEIPQLFNVLVGNMSLVGPRPEMPFLVEKYNELQCERLNVKPGITGLWQISADRTLAIHENMDYDLYYVHEQSFILDI